MDSRDFQIAVSGTIFDSRKGGKDFTIKLKNGHVFDISSVSWCASCDKFHINIGDPV